MLKSLDYSVSFPTTGRSFQNRIDFAPGLTAITGRNEAGKTLNIEMIGYCLFGKDALRGLASDYKNLDVTLHLEIKGHDVLIERAKRETLTVNGEVKAVGAQAINAEVPKLLGFGLDVFNVACAAQQGDLDALTKMRPGERRQMVDRLIGIDLLEQIEKDCRTEAKAQETVAASLIVSVPHEPVQPDNYQPSAELSQTLEQVQAQQIERDQLLRVAEPAAPIEPEAPAETDVAMLETHEANRQVLLQAQARLQGQIAGIPEPRHTRAELEKAVAYSEYADEVRRRGPKPDYSEGDLVLWTRILDAQDAETEEVVCPGCDLHFHTGLSKEQEELLGQKSPLTRREISEQQQRRLRWTHSMPLAEVEAFVIDNLQQEILAHARVDDRVALSAELNGLVVPADRSGELRAARTYREARSIYDERAARYSQDMATFRDAQARLGELPDQGELLERLRTQLGDARAFEGAVQRYQHDLERYEDITRRAREARELAEGYKAGGTSLRNARVRVKQELAPDLSRAASTLLYAMTDGERRHIDVDEDFNILVDGQPLQTLSGSGKSVVNLALRIGLGQVLTQKVLPIFLGDEIDKDMDKLRASSTHGTLQNLRQYLAQIIIVTHKDEFEADHIINLDTVSA